MRLRNDFCFVLMVTSTAYAAGLQRAAAQDALRNALLTDASARVRAQSRPQGDDVLRLGPVTFNVDLGYSLEASDNIRYARTDREADLIQRPSLSLGLTYPYSAQSRLDVNLALGYDDYISNSEFDRFFVTPGSEVAFDVKVGDGMVTIYDRVDYSQDVATEGALSGVARLPRLENVVGVRSVWRFSKWTWQVGYSHLNVFVTEDGSATSPDFNYLERADEQFFGRVSYDVHPAVNAGIEVSGSLSDYVAPVQRDRNTVSAGPTLTWTAADALELTLRGGAAYTDFQPTPLAEGSDLTSFYAGCELNHRLTRYITYRFSLTHDIRPGVNPGRDYIESTYVGLDISWAMTRYVSLTGNVFGEASEEVGLEREKYRRIGTSLGASYKLTGRLSLFGRYAFVARDSDDESRSYTQNRATLGGSYRF
jgi:Putative beta-barrel porin 2